MLTAGDFIYPAMRLIARDKARNSVNSLRFFRPLGGIFTQRIRPQSAVAG
jgi:hypothetical protein